MGEKYALCRYRFAFFQVCKSYSYKMLGWQLVIGCTVRRHFIIVNERANALPLLPPL
jgi:hypothetical protein